MMMRDRLEGCVDKQMISGLRERPRCYFKIQQPGKILQKSSEFVANITVEKKHSFIILNALRTSPAHKVKVENTSRTGHQSTAGHTHAHNLDSRVDLNACFYTVGGNQTSWRKLTQAQGEHADPTQNDASGCEVMVLSTQPLQKQNSTILIHC